MRPPNYPQPGPIRLEWARSVVDAIRAVWPVETPTVRPSITSGGTGYHAQPAAARQRGAAAPPLYRPFEIVAWSTDSPTPQPLVRVVISTVAGETPPGFSASDSPPFLLVPSSGTNVVYLEVRTSGDTYSGCAIKQSANVPNSNDGTSNIPLGAYTYTTDPNGSTLAVTNYGYGPATVNICRAHFTNPAEYNVSVALAYPVA